MLYIKTDVILIFIKFDHFCYQLYCNMFYVLLTSCVCLHSLFLVIAGLILPNGLWKACSVSDDKYVCPYFHSGKSIDWIQCLKRLFINVSYHNLVASLTLMALKTEPPKVRLATSIRYDTLMKNCFQDWNQSSKYIELGKIVTHAKGGIHVRKEAVSFYSVPFS